MCDELIAYFTAGFHLGDLHGPLWLFLLPTNTYFYFMYYSHFIATPLTELHQKEQNYKRTCKMKYKSQKKKKVALFLPFLLRVSALWSRSSILQPFPNTCAYFFFFYLFATETSHSEAGTAQLSSLKRPTIDWTRAWQLLAATSLLFPTPTMGQGHRLSCSYLSSVLLHCRTGTLWLSPSSVYWVIFPFSLSPPRRPHRRQI